MLRNTIGKLIHSSIYFSKIIELHLKHTIPQLVWASSCAILSCCSWGFNGQCPESTENSQASFPKMWESTLRNLRARKRHGSAGVEEESGFPPTP